MALKKSQKAIVLLSGFWTAACMLLSAAMSVSGYRDTFSPITFLTMTFIFSLPIILYWSGVWIWGFGYIWRAFTSKALKKFAVSSVKLTIFLVCVGFLCFFVSLFLEAKGLKIPPSAYVVVLISVISAFRKQEENFDTGGLNIGKAFLYTTVGLIAFLAAYFSVFELRHRNSHEAAFNNALEKMERSYPAYAQLKRLEPEVYNKIVTVFRKGEEQKLSQDELSNAVAIIISEYTTKKTPYLDDALIVRRLEMELAMAEDLSVSAPEKCAALMLGTPQGNITKFVSDNTANKSLNLLNDIVVATRINNAQVASEKEAQAILFPIAINISKTENRSIDEVINAFGGKGEPREVCKILMSFSRNLLALPSNKSASFVRYGAIPETN